MFSGEKIVQPKHLGLAGSEPVGLIEVAERIRRPYVEAEWFQVNNRFWIFQKEFEHLRCYCCSSMLARCLLQRAAFFQRLKKSFDQDDIGIAIADCSE